MTSTPAARTSTLLFTDIEGSTRLWQEDSESMAADEAVAFALSE